MLLSLRRHRRIVGRSKSAGFHRNAAAGGRFGTQRNAMLAGPTRWDCGSERRSDALAHRKLALLSQRSRSARAGAARVGCGAVSRPRIAAGSLEPRS